MAIRPHPTPGNEDPDADFTWLEQLPGLERLQWDAALPLDSIPQGVRGKLKSLWLEGALLLEDQKEFPEWVCKLPELELVFHHDVPAAEQLRLPANLSFVEFWNVREVPQPLPSTIKTLYLQQSKTDACEPVLMSELPGLIDLEVMCRDDDDPFPWKALINRLKQPQCKLQSLALHDVPEEDDAYIKLCGALKTIQSLQKLTLDISLGMDDQRMTCVLDSLPHLHSLQAVSLRVNVLRFGPCISDFLNAIKSCATLRKLDLILWNWEDGIDVPDPDLLEKQLETIRKAINPLIELTITRLGP